MSVTNQSQNSNPSQVLQQRLAVREQEINALKMQNRHLLGKLEELEKDARPNQINTQFVADEVQRHLNPVINQLQGTITNSFEILQSTMRGIYQQSQRAQQAVEDMSAHSRDLEVRMNEQRKADQNFYQDKMFSMIGAFCDRVERQIDIRMKALSTVELMNTKQNETLADIETIKTTLAAIQKNTETNRGEISRIERNAAESNEKLIDVQMQMQNSGELVRDTLQQIQNHRAEFKIIRSELRQAIDTMSRLMNGVIEAGIQVEAEAAESEEQDSNSSLNEIDAEPAIDESKIINDLITQKHRELESIERNIEVQGDDRSKEDAAMILSLLRAQKAELQRVAQEAKTYIKEKVRADGEDQRNDPNNSINP